MAPSQCQSDTKTSFKDVSKMDAADYGFVCSTDDTIHFYRNGISSFNNNNFRSNSGRE